ncbi:hypothetical protein [Rosistilla oblonga]|uniref:Uncharacterized protein n=1 Tax=Rosistilla oblonga TaxID=2527990 RepID=A0A518ITS6_9BACT|nr:hypothetical protein [Rosistilla oblonga]QDV56488.1 hypothetical protein Mal33_24790 [Rosistilla oblonga]
MITDIPTADDFAQTGIDYLNLAWDAVADLAFNFEDAKEAFWDDADDIDVDEMTSEYWTAAQRPISTAVSLAHQGGEFLLKSIISRTSPFLLISGNPSSWPADVTVSDTPYSAFRTIDAQDLVRVHDSVASLRLPSDFARRFDELRQKRNSIMHTVDRHLRVEVLDVFRDVLEITHHLIRPLAWVEKRRQFLESCTMSVAYSTEHVDVRMARDFLRLANLLQPAEVAKYFDIDKKQRRYYCWDCQFECCDHYFDAKSAVLRPNTPSSTTVFCFICGNSRTIRRLDCSHPDCKGNVIDTEEGTCLTCFETRDITMA